MGILGLERRLARTLESKGNYGILQRYLQRSLMWQREAKSELTPIVYSEDRFVPSWSWMAYTGAIKYMAAPFDGVDWNNEDIRVNFEEGSLRMSTRNHIDGHTRPEITALSKQIKTTGGIVDILRRISFDAITVDDLDILRCVVLGIDKPNGAARQERKHYVLVIKPSVKTSDDIIYTRAGVGFLLASHIVMDTGEWVRVQ